MFKAIRNLCKAIKNGDIVPECNYLCFAIRSDEPHPLSNKEFIDVYWSGENQTYLDEIEKIKNIKIVRGIFAYEIYSSWDWKGHRKLIYKLCHIPSNTENSHDFYNDDYANFNGQSYNADLDQLIEFSGKNKLIEMVYFKYRGKSQSFLMVPIISMSIIEYIGSNVNDKLLLAAKRMSKICPIFIINKANIFKRSYYSLYHMGKELPSYQDFYENIKNYIADIDIYAYGLTKEEVYNFKTSFKEIPIVIATDISYKAIRNYMGSNCCLLSLTDF